MNETEYRILPTSEVLITGKHYAVLYQWPPGDFPASEDIANDLSIIGVKVSGGNRDVNLRNIYLVIEPVHDIAVGQVLMVGVSRGALGAVTDTLPEGWDEWSLDLNELPGDFGAIGKKLKSSMIWVLAILLVCTLIGVYLWRR